MFLQGKGECKVRWMKKRQEKNIFKSPFGKYFQVCISFKLWDDYL
jgi:hypothetical protein